MTMRAFFQVLFFRFASSAPPALLSGLHRPRNSAPPPAALFFTPTAPNTFAPMLPVFHQRFRKIILRRQRVS